MVSDARSGRPWGEAAIVGIGETDYVRGADEHVCDLILSASMEAIVDAGLSPADIDGIIPPPGFMSTEEIAAHLGVPDVAFHVSVLMGGASPTASLQTAAMAVHAGLAHYVLVTFGWNGYSALRPKPDARPTRRTMNLGPMGETVRTFYAPYGLMSAAQHYSLTCGATSTPSACPRTPQPRSPSPAANTRTATTRPSRGDAC